LANSFNVDSFTATSYTTEALAAAIVRALIDLDEMIVVDSLNIGDMVILGETI